jgi:hypothetical protein
VIVTIVIGRTERNRDRECAAQQERAHNLTHRIAASRYVVQQMMDQTPGATCLWRLSHFTL